jgi:hypothetical protein
MTTKQWLLSTQKWLLAPFCFWLVMLFMDIRMGVVPWGAHVFVLVINFICWIAVYFHWRDLKKTGVIK